jgi:hypothetical protein
MEPESVTATGRVAASTAKAQVPEKLERLAVLIPTPEEASRPLLARAEPAMPPLAIRAFRAFQ